MSQGSLNADPLIFGSGPCLFEVFLEPTCPFSVKAFNKIDDLLAEAGEEKISVRIWLHSQPWHMYSPVLTRYILAASTLRDGKAAARKVMQAIADHREEFEFTDHASGPNMDATPNDILARVKDYSGVDAMAPFALNELQMVIKQHTKYARQNGIHVSPTFMVDGLIQPDLGSGDEVSVWAKRLLGA